MYKYREVVVDAGSPLAARAAKDLQESVLFPLSQEMFLNITYLSRMLQDSPSAPPSGTRACYIDGVCLVFAYAMFSVKQSDS
ncbi:hypothetical protein E2C01_027162 [Portunus trituberculatus]|uniref:Uncharacterized protein n=1 Tax=Portunus trituberculatus TaxID=210409 RepID=A0A5B7EKE2_PORTR|nr:hypothetical protein [Portunus trituberculatus]